MSVAVGEIPDNVIALPSADPLWEVRKLAEVFGAYLTSCTDDPALVANNLRLLGEAIGLLGKLKHGDMPEVVETLNRRGVHYKHPDATPFELLALDPGAFRSWLTSICS